MPVGKFRNANAPLSGFPVAIFPCTVFFTYNLAARSGISKNRNVILSVGFRCGKIFLVFEKTTTSATVSF